MFELRDDGQFILQAIHFDDADSPACVGSVEPGRRLRVGPTAFVSGAG